MARAVINYTVSDEGRDLGKTFVITEMSATQAERWATRVLLAFMQSNPEVPEGLDQMGLAGLAQIGIKALAGVRWETLDPLLEEMMTCVKIMPDKKKPAIIRDLIESDIEEVATRIKLRAEIWTLHMGFLKTVAPSIFAGTKATAG